VQAAIDLILVSLALRLYRLPEKIGTLLEKSNNSLVDLMLDTSLGSILSDLFLDALYLKPIWIS